MNVLYPPGTFVRQRNQHPDYNTHIGIVTDYDANDGTYRVMWSGSVNEQWWHPGRELVEVHINEDGWVFSRRRIPNGALVAVYNPEKNHEVIAWGFVSERRRIDGAYEVQIPTDNYVNGDEFQRMLVLPEHIEWVSGQRFSDVDRLMKTRRG